MIRFLTAGESHGKSLSVIIEGFPSNLPVDTDSINNDLRRRQSGYGRGGRMKIEKDRIEILSGIRFGRTLGSPVSLLIKNNDWENWTEKMAHEGNGEGVEKVTIPRPGHADLVGVQKYAFNDIRNSIERSSARETAARVAAGSFAKELLKQFGIKVVSFVESIGGIDSPQNFTSAILENRMTGEEIVKLSATADESELRVGDKSQEEKIIELIKETKKSGDTLGGVFTTVALNMPAGLGSFMHYDRRLDAKIASAFLSINAVKGVEIGNAFENAGKPGSRVHDEIIVKNGIPERSTNRAGGTEGGVSTGMPLVVRAAMKPISTLMMPLKSINLATMEGIEARRERSDFVAVPACSVIGEAMLAWVIAEEMVIKFGGDSIGEMIRNYNSYMAETGINIKNNFTEASDEN
ncbi:MAG: chorismate synthase [Ignavibacteriaceae bacterium]|nr:chorismate synthase [Ignavibacteriaceae bacterium]